MEKRVLVFSVYSFLIFGESDAGAGGDGFVESARARWERRAQFICVPLGGTTIIGFFGVYVVRPFVFEL
jgi:hypothetical protein